jgi:aromatic ring-cleaving dioxygenase
MLESNLGTPTDSQVHLKIQPLETVGSYHAHIYFDGPAQQGRISSPSLDQR